MKRIVKIELSPEMAIMLAKVVDEWGSQAHQWRIEDIGRFAAVQKVVRDAEKRAREMKSWEGS